MPVRSERSGPVTTVILDRQEARNAVDREHADALAEAFRTFDADDSAAVAVLWGAGGTFCSGADLKRMDNRTEPDGDGPMGPSRLLLSKPVVAAVAGTRSRAGSSSRSGATCASSRRTRCSVSSAAASAYR